MNLRSRYKKLVKLGKISLKIIREFGIMYFFNVALTEIKKEKLEVFAPEIQQNHIIAYSETAAYNSWCLSHEITDDKKLNMLQEINLFKIKPKISVICSISKNNIKYLKTTLFSITNQIYDNFEIYFVHRGLQEKQINEIKSEVNDNHIITDCKDYSVNHVIESASGEFLAFIDCGNTLTIDALFRTVEELNRQPNADVIYFDEEQIQLDGRRLPFFKPDWSPDLFTSFDYISSFYVVRTEIVKKIGGFRERFKTAKHYDLLLRLTEQTLRIFHVPTITVHVNLSVMESLAVYEQDAINAISDKLVRLKINGEVTHGLNRKNFRIKYRLESEPKVSIIIPTKDQKNLLKRCINSIEKNNQYKNYEIIIVDNNSVKRETIEYLTSLPYTVLRYAQPFNFSKINNYAASHASGDYLLFLNDDAAPLERAWLSEMMSIAIQENVGIVGAKLIISNGTIQHAGLVFLKTGAGFHPLQGIDADSPGYFGFVNTIRNYSAVTGACLLIKKEIFQKIGGFDNDFDLYYGDADLCLKTLNAGYKIVYTPYAKLLHEGSSSIKETSRSFFAIENHYYFIKKWPYLKNGDPFYNPNLGWDYKIA